MFGYRICDRRTVLLSDAGRRSALAGVLVGTGSVMWGSALIGEVVGN